MAKKSIIDEICDYIKKQKLSPIPVQTLNEEAESTRYFGGDLKEFIAAAKTLGAKGIFVEELYRSTATRMSNASAAATASARRARRRPRTTTAMSTPSTLNPKTSTVSTSLC